MEVTSCDVLGPRTSAEIILSKKRSTLKAATAMAHGNLSDVVFLALLIIMGQFFACPHTLFQDGDTEGW